MKKFLFKTLPIVLLSTSTIPCINAFADTTAPSPDNVVQPTVSAIVETTPGVVQLGENVIPQTRSISLSPIYIGICWKYTTVASGKKLKSEFRKYSTTSGAINVGILVASVSEVAGPLDPAIAVLVGAGNSALHSILKEGANLIQKHPKSGRIFMYADHVTFHK
ncbi:MAG: hypothetical protein LBD38_02730 [Streptococcaceae bacterium]|nr:hypothetical protein [Streptococcaceae bacterium]